jgi:hypothetical protein
VIDGSTCLVSRPRTCGSDRVRCLFALASTVLPLPVVVQLLEGRKDASDAAKSDGAMASATKPTDPARRGAHGLKVPATRSAGNRLQQGGRASNMPERSRPIVLRPFA